MGHIPCQSLLFEHCFAIHFAGFFLLLWYIGNLFKHFGIFVSFCLILWRVLVERKICFPILFFIFVENCTEKNRADKNTNHKQ